MGKCYKISLTVAGNNGQNIWDYQYDGVQRQKDIHVVLLVQVPPEVRLFLYHRYTDIDLDQVLIAQYLLLVSIAERHFHCLSNGNLRRICCCNTYVYMLCGDKMFLRKEDS